MEITMNKIKTKYLKQILGEPRIAKYMKYPTKDSKRRFTLHAHGRGRSLHFDLRMEMNGYLNGWTLLIDPGDMPKITTEKDLGKFVRENIKKIAFRPDNKGQGIRAETKCISEYCDEWKYNIVDFDDKAGLITIANKKIEGILERLARQPKVWLKVHGVTKPGTVGATRHEPGVFYIVDKGKFYEGVNKPYFHEYFLKGTKLFKDWTRVIVRGVRVRIIDPVTKRPKKGQYEIMWRAMIPKEQEPYVLSKRARKKAWYPPKDIIPIPPEWRKGEKYNKWLEWVKTKWKEEPKGTEKLSKSIKWSLSLISWKGPKIVRDMPKLRWYLRIDDGEDMIRSYQLNSDPTLESPLVAVSEGRVNKKWLDYEGTLQPGEPYNPNKRLKAKVVIEDKGTGTIDYKREEPEVFSIKFKGDRLKGTWILEQEEEGSSFYTMDILHPLNLSIIEGKFVYHRHLVFPSNTKEIVKRLPDNKFIIKIDSETKTITPKIHYDLRLFTTANDMEEFNLYDDIRNKGPDKETKAVYKKGYDPKPWYITSGTLIKRMVGSIVTYVDAIDHGTFKIIEKNPKFMSIFLYGDTLKGYYIAKSDGTWIFKKSRLPHPLYSILSGGNPGLGDYYEPFKIVKKKNWDYYWVNIYDIRKFTRCIVQEEVTNYLDINIPKGVEPLLCLYYRPGTIHGVRVAKVKFSDSWSKDEAIQWIKKNKLHTWWSPQIRG